MKIEYVHTEAEKEFMDTMKENLNLIKDPEMLKEGLCLAFTFIVIFFGLIMIGV